MGVLEGHGHSPRNGMQRRRSEDLAGQWFREPYRYWNYFRGVMGKHGWLYGGEVVVGYSRDSVLVGLCHDELSFTF